MNRKKKIYLEPVVFNVVNFTLLALLSAVMLYPMLNTLAISFNDGLDTVRGGIYLWPRIFTLKNYDVVLRMHTIYSAFHISVIKTIITVATNLALTSMLAYTLSRRNYVFVKPITIIFVLTMYFNAGMIPTYILYKDLHLINTFTVYWLPNMISAFNLVVMRTYIRSLPESLIESAKIDGASEFIVFARIILPLCLPTLATIALFVAVGSWNSWFDSFLYNSAKQELSTLQYELQKLLASAMMAGQTGGGSAVGAGAEASSVAGGAAVVTSQALRAAITVVVSVPILLVYPFLQRYFVHGLTIGGVKE